MWQRYGQAFVLDIKQRWFDKCHFGYIGFREKIRKPIVVPTDILLTEQILSLSDVRWIKLIYLTAYIIFVISGVPRENPCRYGGRANQSTNVLPIYTHTHTLLKRIKGTLIVLFKCSLHFFGIVNIFMTKANLNIRNLILAKSMYLNTCSIHQTTRARQSMQKLIEVPNRKLHDPVSVSQQYA